MKGFCLIQGKIFFVMIRADCIIFFRYELHLVTCLSCSKKKKKKEKSQINHVLKRITCCTFDIIFIYLKII